MGTYEDRMNDYREEEIYNASHAIGETVEITAYIGFEHILFDITDSVASEANISLEEFKELEGEDLNKTLEELLPWLIWDEMEPGGSDALERVDKFSTEVDRYSASGYDFGESGDCEAFNVEATWVDDNHNQVEVNFYLSSKDKAKVDVPIDREGYYYIETLESDLLPSKKVLDGDFGIDEILP